MIVKKSNPVYDIDVELYMAPKMLRHEMPNYWSSTDSKTKKKIFGIAAPHIRAPNGMLIVNCRKLKTSHANLKTVKFRCVCCEKLLEFTASSIDRYSRDPLEVIQQVLPKNIALVERRFVNINKRSAIYYIPVHAACKTVLELNPLAYLPKLEEIAKTWDNIKFKVD